ncbi:MAG: MoaD/ThiS family protein [Endomicrobiia bacterium]|nr:MoaD/ThiS family protein [Endomicrobiia bacterium]
MIKVEFELAAAIKRKKAKSGKFSLNLPDDAVLAAVVENKLGYTPTESRYFTYLINEKAAKLSARLKDGDDVKILLPIGGG